MARKVQVPNPLQRRHLLEQKLAPERAVGIAAAYAEAEQWVDAIAFYAKAEAFDELGKIAERAVEQGDEFLFSAAMGALAQEANQEQWEKLARAAEGLGKMRYAENARRVAGRERTGE